MRRGWTVASTLATVLVASTSANAQPDDVPPAPSPDSPPAGPVTRTEIVEAPKDHPATPSDPRHSVSPTFELTGKSDGEATVRLGVDLLRAFENSVNELHVKAAVEAASHDGLTTILSGGSAGFETESAVALSLDVTYTTLQAKPGLPVGKLDAFSIGARRRLLRDCIQSGFKTPTYRGRAVDLTSDREVDEIDPGDFCADARKTLADAENTEKLPLPKRQLTFSFSAARSVFNQLSPTGADPMQLAPTKVRRPGFSVAMGYAQYAPAERLSFELATRLDAAYEATGQKARWCTPVGQVIRADGANPAESCTELPLGDPVRTTTLSTAAYLGFVGDDYNWRIAMGPTTRFGFGGNNVSYEVGFELPFYLVRASAGFSGIVRVAPAALLTRDADGVEDTKVLLTLTLLGNRTLFDTAFH